ncbi:sugar transferase [Neobacillus sp. NPDC093182]|uniref:sugar transferase n=1 Tax=Neobacillus sp. NPDC093182 TaxID=3364297 RepID=UPI0037FB4DB9
MKRMFDFTVSLVLLVSFFPFFFIFALLVKLKLGSPIIFKQQRPGLYEKPFYLYKLRTMTDERDQKGQLMPDDKRLTTFGQFLRKYSIDEYPQLINVIKGDISLVGPRPLLMEYLPLYTQEQSKRHNVRPGITGWAQINGRNAINWEEKFSLDIWYINNRNFLLDLKILILTINKVIKKEGIKHASHVTMPLFKGGVERNAGKYD